MNTKNLNLQNAKNGKNDEFYTQLIDIEKELQHYKDHFRDKVVYCNCDDFSKSNFFKYFQKNYNELGLKEIISSYYVNKRDIYSTPTPNIPSYSIYSNNNIQVGDFDEDGDFRSDECIRLLKKSDIVVTNPPFSLFREYVAQLIEHDKKFVIIGNMNAITYKEIFPLIKDNKMWMGVSITSGDREFEVPKDYPLLASQCHINENGNRFVRIKGVRWFTNLEHEIRHETLPLTKNYSPEKYPKYDNYDAINVDKTKDIPMDYQGKMGVPITFLDKYNPDQFEIIGMDRPLITEMTGKVSRFKLNGKEKYARIVIRQK